MHSGLTHCWELVLSQFSAVTLRQSRLSGRAQLYFRPRDLFARRVGLQQPWGSRMFSGDSLTPPRKASRALAQLPIALVTHGVERIFSLDTRSSIGWQGIWQALLV